MTRRGGTESNPSQAHLRLGSGSEDILLEVSAYVRLSEGEQLFSFVSASMSAAFELIFTYTTAWGSTIPLSLLCFPSCYSVTMCHFDKSLSSSVAGT